MIVRRGQEIFLAPDRQIKDTRVGPKLFLQDLTTALPDQARNFAVRVVEIAEDDGPYRTRLRACGLDLAVSDGPVFLLGAVYFAFR